MPSGMSLAVYAFSCALGWLTWYIVSRITNDEKPVTYTCKRPEVAIEGVDWSDLDAPTIKVISAATKIGGVRRKKRHTKPVQHHSDPLQAPGSSAIRCYDPATGQYLGIVNPATNNGVDRAIESATEAQKAWALTTFAERRKVLKTMLQYILDHQDTIAYVACVDSGKTMVDASLGEILVTVEKLQWTIDHGEKALRPERRPTNLLMTYKVNEVRWEPVGVVAACVSWNYPFHNFMGPVISALFSGNAIVVKGAEQTAWSSSYWSNIVRGALKACGHNPNLAQSIICWPTVAEHLTAHPGISHLTFIGSQPVAHHIAKSAAKSLTPLCLELGGKDPAIILDSVNDIDRVIATMIRGVFQSAGQNCIGIERIICTPAIYPHVIAKLTPIVQSLRVGRFSDANVDVGACISDARFAHLEKLVAAAVHQGAQLLTGGTRYAHPKHPKGHFFAPTLLANVTASMAIANEELFAPIALVMRADSVAHAVHLANGTGYALGASVFGSRAADLEAVTRGVRAGMVAVNDFAAYYAVQLPFGGAKGSGYGRFAGEEGLRALCNTKAVCRDRWPALMRTTIPAPMRQPYQDVGAAYRVAKGIVKLGYAGLGSKGEGIANILGFGGDNVVGGFLLPSETGVVTFALQYVQHWLHKFQS